jgi:hypothetical protein
VATTTTFTSIHHQYSLRLARPRDWKVLVKNLSIASGSEHPGRGAVPVVGSGVEGPTRFLTAHRVETRADRHLMGRQDLRRFWRLYR